jgi:hypothetical protein
VPKSVVVETHRFSQRGALCEDVPSAVQATRLQGLGRQRVRQPCSRGVVAQSVLRRLRGEEW